MKTKVKEQKHEETVVRDKGREKKEEKREEGKEGHEREEGYKNEDVG